MTNTTQDLIRDDVMDCLENILNDNKYFTPEFLAKTLYEKSFKEQADFINVLANINKLTWGFYLKEFLTPAAKEFLSDLVTEINKEKTHV